MNKSTKTKTGTKPSTDGGANGPKKLAGPLFPPVTGFQIGPRRQGSTPPCLWRALDGSGPIQGMQFTREKKRYSERLYSPSEQLMIEDGVKIPIEDGARENPWIESLWGRMKVETESLIHQGETLEQLDKSGRRAI